jgi:hypothetical protein
VFLTKGDVIVTTITAACAAGHTRSAVLFAIVVAFALGGCESSTSLFGSNAAPEANLATAAAPTPTASNLTRVSIAPVIGAPDAVARQLQQDFNAALDKSKISVVPNGESAQYTLRGYIVASKDKTATKVSYIWDINDVSGKRVNRITGEESIPGASPKDPWTAVTPAITQSVAQKSAASFGTWLPASGAGAVASATPVGVGAPIAQPATVAANSVADTTTQSLKPQPVSAPGPVTGSIAKSQVSAIVPSVSGAPGDGSTALTSALQAELSKNGVTLAEQSGPSSYKVEGIVKVGQARDGKQPIQIDWQVKDPAGKKLGTVSQKNEIPEGSLDGAWGRTADAAAAAAAQGILKLLPAKAVN